MINLVIDPTNVITLVLWRMEHRSALKACKLSLYVHFDLLISNH